MKAADVMVCAVISVRPSARVEEVASILLANRISHLFAGQIFQPPGTAPVSSCLGSPHEVSLADEPDELVLLVDDGHGEAW